MLPSVEAHDRLKPESVVTRHLRRSSTRLRRVVQRNFPSQSWILPAALPQATGQTLKLRWSIHQISQDFKFAFGKLREDLEEMGKSPTDCTPFHRLRMMEVCLARLVDELDDPDESVPLVPVGAFMRNVVRAA